MHDASSRVPMVSPTNPVDQEKAVPRSERHQKTTRREFVKKAAYIAPAILTLKAAPAFAKAGSVKPPTPKPKPPKP
jgi:hypothetical protein